MVSIESKSIIEKSVVEIECITSGGNRELGTGFFIDKDIVVTASHVIKEYYSNSDNVEIIITPQKLGSIEGVKVIDVLNRRNNFIAILKLERPIENACIMKFIDGYEVKIDDEYYTFGHPAYKRGGDSIENKVKTSINESESDKANWDLCINGERANNFKGFSGAPVIINNMLVGIMQIQNDSNGNTVSLGMSSFDIMKEFISENYYQDYDCINRIEELKQEFEDSIDSIDDIDRKLRYSTNPSIGLDFFESDDEEFKEQFQGSLCNNKCYIVGKSREEALYSVLYELKYIFNKNNVIIVNNIECWQKLIGKVKDFILIPNFYIEEIVALKENMNIFIYGEDEHCINKNKIIIKRRIRMNIEKKLIAAGLDSSVAYEYVSKTNGLFAFLKRKLFNGSYNKEPKWYQEKNDSLIAALLCGRWTECDGDKEVIEKISGKKYEEFKNEVLKFSKGGEPFVIEINQYGRNEYQLASAELAWEYLGEDVTDDKWEDIKDIIYETVIKKDPIFDKPFENHFELSISTEKPYNSNKLKKGMIRTLIFKALFGDGNGKYQREVDEVIKKILDEIKDVQYWGYISQFFTDLCEASPSEVIKRLKNEIKNPSGLKELFEAENDRYSISARNYYTNILWAVEQLLVSDDYAVEAVKWLFMVDDMNLKYSISNSPKSTLNQVFCAWYNMSALTVDTRIKLVDYSIKKHESAWMLFFNELPGKCTTIVGTLNKPKYREISEVGTVTNVEISKLYYKYANACIDNINGNIDRWKLLISEISIFSDEMLDSIVNKLSQYINEESDLNKCLIKDELRDVIYKNRKFAKVAWAMSEEKINKLEEVYREIKFSDKVYDYLYIFKNGQLPILNPIKYDNNEYSYEKERQLECEELKVIFKEIKDSNLSLRHLSEVVESAYYSKLGEYIAKYYSNGIYDEQVYTLLLKIDNGIDIVKRYVSEICGNSTNWEYFDSILKLAYNYDDKRLYAELLRNELLKYENKPRIMNAEDKIKKLYWSGSYFLVSEDEESIIWVLSELKYYNNFEYYVKCLFKEMKYFTGEEILNYMVMINEFNLESINDFGLISCYLKELMHYINEQCDGRYEIYDDIMKLELSLRGIIEWGEMKCTQYNLKNDPQFYCEVINIVFKHEGGEKNNLSQQIIDSWGKFYYDAKFCPCDNKGNVDLGKLRSWVKKFTEILNKQKQSNLVGVLLGGLFAYSPVGSDGYYPHESIREVIEEMSDDSMIRAYVNAQYNKRGVFWGSDGKEEKEIALKYKENADALRIEYSETAKIYDILYKSYMNESKEERRSAEDEW